MPVPTSVPTDPAAVRRCLLHWIRSRAGADAAAWTLETAARIAEGAPDRVVYTAFSAAPRHVGKADLALSAADLDAARAARPGWTPTAWSVDQAARAALLLALPTADLDTYDRRLEMLFAAADVAEAVALHQAVPLLPLPARHLARAADGVRSNITSVFDAVMLRNPYPSEQFSDNAFNQGVLKAVFIGRPLRRIAGLDQRANPALAEMMVDYAHERWAAGRTVTPELWRPVGPFADAAVVADLARVLAQKDPIQQEAAALALVASPSPAARRLLGDVRPDLLARAASGALDWNDLGRTAPDPAAA
jgi:hypothetical protein